MREKYKNGRLRLTYEANPIAFLVEQANGEATDGQKNILNLATCFLREKSADENFFKFSDKKPLFFIRLSTSLSFINN